MRNSPAPSWRALLRGGNQTPDSYWGGMNCVFTRSSAASLALIFETYLELTQKETLSVFLPGYFCQDTLNQISGDRIQFTFYELDENMDPDWKLLKEKKEIPADIFVFCHYFGIVHNVTRAVDFCNQKKAILIEDCAHVLYPASSYATKGDFAIFSPHKVLPVHDGGIVLTNKSKLPIVAQIMEKLAERCKETEKDTCLVWRAKKALQKLTGFQKKVEYVQEVHYGHNQPERNAQVCMTEYSKNLLLSYTKEDFKKMAYLRRYNAEVMNYLVKQIEPQVICLTDTATPCPYFAVYNLKNVKNSQTLVTALQKKSITPLHWPDLPEVLQQEDFSVTKAFSKDLMVIPIHQGIAPQQIAKLADRENSEKTLLKLQWLDESAQSRELWKQAEKEIDFCNIPQDWDYGTVKEQTEGWGVLRAVVTGANGEPACILQVLLKKKAGITVAARINRGPLMTQAYDTTANKLQVMDLLRKKIPHPIPVIYAPDVEFTGENLVQVTQRKWRHWGVFGFPSGVIDLRQSEEAIRKNLDSKWRNQLVSSQKQNPQIHEDFDRFNQILQIYEQDQREKHYKGMPSNVLLALKDLPETPLRLMYLTDEEDQIIAFDIFYRTENFGLYLVGWNGPAGRKIYANNLLLYHATILFSQQGVRWMDLGGIDYIATEENAKFKDGMKPSHYQLLGEFICL